MLPRLNQFFDRYAHGRYFAKALSGTLLLKVVSYIAGFVLSVMLARLLGVSEFGLYLLALSWLRMLHVAARFGTDFGAARFLSHYREEENWSDFHGYKRFSQNLVLIKSIGLTLIAIVAVQWLPALDAHQQSVFTLAFLSLPFWALLFLYQAGMRALHKPVQGLLPDNIIRPALQIIFLLAVLMLGHTLHAWIGMMSYVFSTVTACAASFYMFRRAQTHIEPHTGNLDKRGEWYSYNFYMMLLAGGSIAMRQTDIIMIGAMLGTHEAGLYGAAVKLANFAEFFLATINPILLPMISGLYHSGQHEKLRSIMRLATIIIFGGTLCITLFLMLFGEWALGFFGDGFTAALTPLHILILGQLVNALAGPVGGVIAMTGHQKFSAGAYGAMLALNVILNLVLIPLYGITGAALATAISFIGWNVLICFYVIKRTGVNTTIFSVRAHEEKS